MLALTPPVEAPIVRHFDVHGSPYAAGRHRGVDLGARPGAAVGAPCDGRVTFAGPTPEGRAVTVFCGGRRVTLLPLTAPVVGAGDVVARGTSVARTTGEPLHLSVRTSSDAYVDPEPLLRRPRPPLGPAPAGPRAWRPADPLPQQAVGHPAPSATSPAPVGHPAPSATSPALVRRPEPSARPPRTTAPWPAWLGAALALGAVDAGRRRRRNARTRLEPATEAPPR